MSKIILTEEELKKLNEKMIKLRLEALENHGVKTVDDLKKLDINERMEIFVEANDIFRYSAKEFAYLFQEGEKAALQICRKKCKRNKASV